MSSDHRLDVLTNNYVSYNDHMIFIWMHLFRSGSLFRFYAD